MRRGLQVYEVRKGKLSRQPVQLTKPEGRKPQIFNIDTAPGRELAVIPAGKDDRPDDTFGINGNTAQTFRDVVELQTASLEPLLLHYHR